MRPMLNNDRYESQGKFAYIYIVAELLWAMQNSCDQSGTND